MQARAFVCIFFYFDPDFGLFCLHFQERFVNIGKKDRFSWYKIPQKATTFPKSPLENSNANNAS